MTDNTLLGKFKSSHVKKLVMIHNLTMNPMVRLNLHERQILRALLSNSLFAAREIAAGAGVDIAALSRAMSDDLQKGLRADVWKKVLSFFGVDGSWRARLDIIHYQSVATETSDFLFLLENLFQDARMYILDGTEEKGHFVFFFRPTGSANETGVLVVERDVNAGRRGIKFRDRTPGPFFPGAGTPHVWANETPNESRLKLLDDERELILKPFLVAGADPSDPSHARQVRNAIQMLGGPLRGTSWLHVRAAAERAGLGPADVLKLIEPNTKTGNPGLDGVNIMREDYTPEEPSPPYAW